jgi:hypothetical protein
MRCELPNRRQETAPTFLPIVKAGKTGYIFGVVATEFATGFLPLNSRTVNDLRRRKGWFANSLSLRSLLGFGC